MADEKIERRVRRFPWVTPSGEPIGQSGITNDELKISQVKPVAVPAIAPMAQRGPVERISPTTSSEDLRLAVPTAADPWATPLGPRQDLIPIRMVLARAHSPVSKAIVALLKSPNLDVMPEARARMQASIARVMDMEAFLAEKQKDKEDIVAKLTTLQNM